MGRGYVFLMLAASLAAAQSSAKDLDLRMMLTIDDTEVGLVGSGAEIRHALGSCNPPRSCSYVGLNREPQIDYAATYEKGGYTIGHRTGPPGPLFDARRKGKGSRDHFSTKEMIAITANYIDGRKTSFVRWISSPLP